MTVKFIKRSILCLAVALLTAVVGLYVYLAFSNDPGHFWRTVSGAQVTHNEEIVSDVHVYNHPDGDLLIDLGEGHGWLVYRTKAQNIAWCNPIRNVQFPRYIYAYDCSSKFCPCVEMGTVKTEADAQLSVTPDSIEFNSPYRGRIRVTWGSAFNRAPK